MSKIARNPVPVPDGVTVTVTGQTVEYELVTNRGKTSAENLNVA